MAGKRNWVEEEKEKRLIRRESRSASAMRKCGAHRVRVRQRVARLEKKSRTTSGDGRGNEKFEERRRVVVVSGTVESESQLKSESWMSKSRFRQFHACLGRGPENLRSTASNQRL